MPPKKKTKREKQKKETIVSFRADAITLNRLKILASYFRRGVTTVIEDLIDHEFERIEKSDPVELKKSEKFVEK